MTDEQLLNLIVQAIKENKLIYDHTLDLTYTPQQLEYSHWLNPNIARHRLTLVEGVHTNVRNDLSF